MMQSEVNMKRKFNIIFVLVLILHALSLSPAFAASEILIEAENFQSVTSGRKITGIGGTSNNAVWYFNYPYTPGLKAKPQGAVYEVNVSEAGTYTIYADISQCGESARCDWSIIVNEGKSLVASLDAINMGKKSLTSYQGALYHMKVGSAWFNKGVNTIRLQLDMNDVNYLSTISCYVDCFKLEKDNFGIEKVTPKELGNVFEESSDVVYEVKYKGKSTDENSFIYEVEDFWGNLAISGKIVSEPGGEMQLMNLGRYKTGWYRFVIYDEAGKNIIIDKPFAVVPNYAERTVKETPFAADCAGAQVISSGEQIDIVARSMRLAGVQWVRERFSWSMVENTKGNRLDYLDDHLETYKENGINVSVVDSGLPNWTKVTDLLTCYKYYKEQGDLYKNRINMWEIYNEYEAGRGMWTGDVYSAFCKAASIGLADSGEDTLVSMNSLCMPTKNQLFIDLMMKNELMKFSDIYNFHAHTTQTKNRVDDLELQKVKGYVDNQLAYSEDKPMWNTEHGMYVPLNGLDQPTIEQRRSQARYFVTSTVQSLANGIDKSFWFLWRTYIEGTTDMSLYDSKRNEPTPAYSSTSILSYVLGEAKMKGILDIDGTEGYVFDSGKEDVLVVWTELPGEIFLHANNDVIITDIMGDSKRVSPVNGKVNLQISHYPVYVRFEGEMPLNDYYPKTFNRPENKSVGGYSAAERVIVAQEFPGANLVTSKTTGYPITEEKTSMNALIYNLNNKEMKGELCIEVEGFDIQVENTQITIPPMSELIVPVELIRNDYSNPITSRYLKMYMNFDGEKTTDSVSAIKIIEESKNLGKEPDIIFKEVLNPDNWNKANRNGADSELKIVNENGVMQFTYTNTPADAWIYPMVKIENPQELSTTDGIVFEYRDAPENVGKGSHNMFVYMVDGREYFLGTHTAYPPSENWQRVELRWEDFILNKTPLGIVDVRVLDPTLIESIAVGGNFRFKDNYYELRNIGFLTNMNVGNDNISVSCNEGEIENIHDASQLSAIKITLDENFLIEKTRILLEDVELENVQKEANTLTVDLSHLAKGAYTLRVIAVDKNNYPTAIKKEFMIN